jgi:1-hydroxycarotenoid 3,4-desaturase
MTAKIVIIGAGMGGLVAALLLAQAGLDVTVCEAAATPGGKLRQVAVGDAHIDAGPTVFTLRPVFEAIFAMAGTRLENHITLEKLDCLARHGWEDGAALDLFCAPERSAAAIGDFAGAAAAKGYLAFAARAKQIFETLDFSFMQTHQPGLAGLVRNAGPGHFGGLLNLSPFSNMWDELGRYFKNAKLRQLFARYATYCGSSPFSAPATLMLIAYAEQMGVWRIKGGMFRLAEVFAQVAQERGAVFRYETKVADVVARNGRVCGVHLANGERLEADAVVANADLAAIHAGYLGPAARDAVAGMMKGAVRSLSALTWAMTATARGFSLAHHNVFFANDYRAEFAQIAARKLPEDPTVYICAAGGEKIFCLVNAPPVGDTGNPTAEEEEKCLTRVLSKLERCGVNLQPSAMIRTGPQKFEAMFQATGGALYGRALAGWRDSFSRPGAKSKLPGFYLAGGAIHPGPGLPMAAISGRLAATRLLADLGSAGTSFRVDMPGGMSMR